MKLAAAIRRGAGLGKQCFDQYVRLVGIDPDTWDGKIHSCALGAALLATREWDVPRARRWRKALALAIDDEISWDVGQAFPVLLEPFRGACPVTGCAEFPNKYAKRLDLVVHLNDEHFWSREDVADWIEAGRWG